MHHIRTQKENTECATRGWLALYNLNVFSCYIWNWFTRCNIQLSLALIRNQSCGKQHKDDGHQRQASVAASVEVVTCEGESHEITEWPKSGTSFLVKFSDLHVRLLASNCLNTGLLPLSEVISTLYLPVYWFLAFPLALAIFSSPHIMCSLKPTHKSAFTSFRGS